MRPSPLLLSIVAALPGCVISSPLGTWEDEGCEIVEASTTSCPAADDVDPDDLFLPMQCGLRIVSVEGEGERTEVQGQVGDPQPACCYPVRVRDPDPTGQCMVGRPYVDDDAVRVADVALGDVDPAAAAWVRAALGEHASVAAFARLSLQLLAHGAPLDLLADVHAAALDEVRHTEACLAVARSLGVDVRPGAFPFASPIDPRVALTDLAADAAREGCLTETLGAHVVTIAAEHARDPAIREVLRALAADEARHAVLSFRVVAWAIATGGPEVREAVEAVFRAPAPTIEVDGLALRSGVDVDVLHRAATDGVADVLRPAARAVLAA